MINTYQSSVAPPPVPPRLHSSHQGAPPVLIPMPVLPQGPSRTLMRFMVALVLFNLLMSVLGFLYLYTKGTQVQQQDMHSSSVGAEPKLSMQTQDRSHDTKRAPHIIFANMEVLRPTPAVKPQPGHLIWDTKHSRYSPAHINYYNFSWLTIEEPGEYFVYSRVTFSKSHPITPLANRVMLRKSPWDKEHNIMQAFCHNSPCTATAEAVVKLEKWNQLSVWTDDISLVRYDQSTAFGLYHL